MAILGRGRPNPTRIIWPVSSLAEIPGTVDALLDDFTLSGSGIVGAEESVPSYSGGGGPSRPRVHVPVPKKPKKPVVVLKPAQRNGNATASLTAVSVFATGFFDLQALIDAENEILLLI